MLTENPSKKPKKTKASTQSKALQEAIKTKKQLPVQETKELMTLAEGDEAKFKRLELRRFYGEPLAYIRGYEYFVYNEKGDSVRIQMDPRAYVTNVETIELAKEAAKNIPEGGSVLEVGTGSGTLSTIVQKLRPDISTHYATDLSPHALALAQENFKKNDIEVQTFEKNLCRDLNIPQPDIIFADMPYGFEETVLGTSNLNDFKHMPKCALIDFRGPFASYLDLIASIQAKNRTTTLLFEIGIISEKELAKVMPTGLDREVIHIPEHNYNIAKVRINIKE